MRPRGRVVVVGSYVQDHAWFCDVFPQRGETRIATGFNTGPGGKGFNQAVACKRQGIDTLFVGCIGDDALGRTAQ
jgi:ribokinase